MPGSFIAVDTGGTFTDLVAFDPATQSIRYTKSLTTHGNPIDGILDCVDKTAVALDRASLFKHGTTLVINTLIERSGPSIALVTTRGFRDIVELGRGNRTEPFDLFYRRSAALVPRQARFEVDERVDGYGEILNAPVRAEVEALAVKIRALGVTAVAVSFLNSYLEPANEREVAGWLREMLPGCFVTSGTELSREWYEFERTTTATANAYTGPKIGGYVKSLDASLGARDFKGQLLIMGSNGGMLSPQRASVAPVMLVESGPIGGCIGAGVYGEALGIPNLIAFDMGGTTAKCALVREGKFDVVSTYYVGGYGRGIPIRTPVVDIVEVGAGGGSIAWLDQESRLHVGPRSAGSMPGPVCYSRGGTEPTVTDANLVLGRLNAGRFQGGEMTLDAAAARGAIEKRLAVPLGYAGEDGLLEVASGVLAISVVTMSGAIKRITVERGKDPRDFALFAYGGGGPLHAVELARELAIPLVVIPPEPGNFSAIGMLLTNIRRDDGRTFVRRLETEAMDAMATVYDEMAAGLRASLAVDFGDLPVTIERHAEMRYVGQFHTVRVPVDEGGADAMRKAFDAEYVVRYGHLIKGTQVEIVSVHVSAFAQSPHPDLELVFKKPEGKGKPAAGSRKVYFSDEKKSIESAVYSRDTLPTGFAATGPAVIEEYGSTTIVGPADRFEIGRLGEIRIHVGRRFTQEPA